MALPSVDVIATKILFDAKDAILALQAWDKQIQVSANKLAMINKVVKGGVLRATGDLKTATPAVKQFFASMKVDPQTIVGLEKVAVLRKLISATSVQMGGNIGAATSAVQKFSQALGVNPSLIRQVGNEMENAGNKSATGMNRAISGVNALRIAMGVLVSMLLFQVLTAISTVFGNAIKQAREFEATLYRISNVERVLSLEGIEVSVKQLKQGIRDIKEALPIFSEEDIAQLVGSVATTTKELGYTGDEIIKLSAAIGILNINSTETESLLATQAKVTNSLISPQSKSVGSLGLAFGKAKIEAKAFEMQILKAGESFADLTEKQKQEIKFQIVLETAGIDDIPIDELRERIREAGGDFQALNEYLQSNDARLQENKAAWDDLGKTLGQLIIPFLPTLTELFNALEDSLNVLKVILIESLTMLGTYGVLVKQVFAGNIKSVDDWVNGVKEASAILRADLTNTFFKEVPESAPDWFTKNYAPLIKQGAETATSAIDEMLDSAEGTEEAESALEDLRQKIEDIKVDARQAQEDLDLKLGQKRSDIDVEYDRKRADEATRYSQKLQDINQDALNKIEDAKRKAREEEKKAEQDLLQKLKELRQRFLMDLEDALRARDARQILRLIKEYNFEKQNILDRKKLDEQQRKDKLAEDLKAIEIERQRRIEQEKIEHRRKLEDLALSKKRELEELALWYKREQEDIQRNVEQKLEKLLNGYIQEGKIHDQQLSAIEGILAQHFGTQMGMVDRLVAYAKLRFAEMGRLSITPATASPYFQSEKSLIPPPVAGQQNALGGYGGAGAVPSSVKKQTEKIKSGRVPAYADGGTLFAKQPTLALFGEKTPEFARFIPASQMGRGGGGDMMGMNGEIGLELVLSPDLEARVVKNAMQGTAKIVTKIRRSKG